MTILGKIENFCRRNELLVINYVNCTVFISRTDGTFLSGRDKSRTILPEQP